MDQNYQGVPPTPDYQSGVTQKAGQPYGNQQGYQTYQQYQQQGYADFTGQAGNPNGVLVVDDYVRLHLKSIGTWTKFLSIFSIVMITLGIALVVVLAISMGNSSYSSGFSYVHSYERTARGVMSAVFIVYAIIFAIFYLPAFWGLSAGIKLKRAAIYGTQADLEGGLRKWKYVCVFFGVLAIIYLALIVLGIIASIAAGALR